LRKFSSPPVEKEANLRPTFVVRTGGNKIKGGDLTC
jgi:hypothetical protein